jgi:hypothetical protein
MDRRLPEIPRASERIPEYTQGWIRDSQRSPELLREYQNTLRMDKRLPEIPRTSERILE